MTLKLYYQYKRAALRGPSRLLRHMCLMRIFPRTPTQTLPGSPPRVYTNAVTIEMLDGCFYALYCVGITPVKGYFVAEGVIRTVCETALLSALRDFIRYVQAAPSHKASELSQAL